LETAQRGGDRAKRRRSSPVIAIGFCVRLPVDFASAVSSGSKLVLAQPEGQKMKRSHFGQQMIGKLKAHEAGIALADIGCKRGVSDASICKWKARFGGKDVSGAKQLRVLEDENGTLRPIQEEKGASNALSST
jgi:putative transposase